MPSRRRRGATLPLVALVLTALMGVAALAIDLAVMGLARQRAQAVADAAALAGAGNLASLAQSTALAGAVTAANNANGSAFQGQGVMVSPNVSVTVTGYVNAPLSFAPAVGFAPNSTDGLPNTVSVSASATAGVSPVCSLPPGMPVAPFGLIGDDPTNTDPAVALVSALLAGTKTLTPGAYQPASAQVVLKMNLWTTPTVLSVPGSFTPLLTSGTGTPYFTTIGQTSDQALAAGQTLPNATLAYDNIGFTRQYLAARLSGSNTAYTHLSPTYDAWFNGKQEQTEGHLLLLPVISQSAKNQLAPVTIRAFATFWVDQPYPTGLSGNGVALGRFLGLTVPGAGGGSCSPAGNVTPPHLLQ